MYITAYLSLCEFQQNKSAFEYRLDKYAQKTQRSNSCIHKIVIINGDLKKWRVTKKILKTAFYNCGCIDSVFNFTCLRNRGQILKCLG